MQNQEIEGNEEWRESPENLTPIEEDIIQRGLVDFPSLGSAEMLFFVCHAMGLPYSEGGVLEPGAFTYYYDRVLSASQNAADQLPQLATAAGLGAQAKTPTGNLVNFVILMFIRQTDFLQSAIQRIAAELNRSTSAGQRVTLPEAVANALVIDVRALPPPVQPNESIVNYMQRNIPIIGRMVVFRQNSTYAATPEAAAETNARLTEGQEPIGVYPWPLYHFTSTGDYVEYWWSLDPVLYFTLPPAVAADPQQAATYILNNMRLGLLPIARDAQSAYRTWEVVYNPATKRWRNLGYEARANPCARARDALRALERTRSVVGSTQEVAVQAPIIARPPPPLQPAAAAPPSLPAPSFTLPLVPTGRPTGLPTPTFGVFAPPPSSLSTANQPRPTTLKRTAAQIEAPAQPVVPPVLQVQPASPVPVPGEVQTCFCEVEPIPFDVVQPLQADLDAWIRVNGEDLLLYSDHVLDLLDDYAAHPDNYQLPLGAATQVGGEGAQPASKRTRVSPASPTAGTQNVVQVILADPALRNFYGSRRLLGFIQGWADRPGILYYNPIVAGQTQTAGNVLCTQCAYTQAREYGERTRRGIATRPEAAPINYPFPLLPGIPLVPAAPERVGIASLGQFTLLGNEPVTALAPFAWPGGVPTPASGVVHLINALSNGYQVPWNWFNYYLGPYAMDRGSLVFCRPPPHYYAPALGIEDVSLPITLGRIVEYDTSNFDTVAGLQPNLLGFFPTRVVVQPLVVGIPSGIVESVPLDSVYPFAVGPNMPSIREVLASRGEAASALYGASSAMSGQPLVNVMPSESSAAVTLRDIQNALAAALASPGVSNLSQDYARISRLYDSIDEQARALGLYVEPGHSLPRDAQEATRTMVRLMQTESARQQPASGVLRASRTPSRAPSVRASFEMISSAPTRAGETPEARGERLEAALQRLEGVRALDASATVLGEPVSPTAPAALRQRVMPGDEVEGALGNAYPLVDTQSAWSILVRVVLARFRVAYPWLIQPLTSNNVVAALAGVMSGYTVYVPASALNAANAFTLPEQVTVQVAMETTQELRNNQARIIAAVDQWSRGPRTTPPPSGGGITFNTLFVDLWNIIFDVPGYTTEENDRASRARTGRHLWAFPGPPSSLRPETGGPALTLGVADPYKVMPSITNGTTFAGDMTDMTDPTLHRLYRWLSEQDSRYTWRMAYTAPRRGEEFTRRGYVPPIGAVMRSTASIQVPLTTNQPYRPPASWEPFATGNIRWRQSAVEAGHQVPPRFGGPVPSTPAAAPAPAGPLFGAPQHQAQQPFGTPAAFGASAPFPSPVPSQTQQRQTMTLFGTPLAAFGAPTPLPQTRAPSITTTETAASRDETIRNAFIYIVPPDSQFNRPLPGLDQTHPGQLRVVTGFLRDTLADDPTNAKTLADLESVLPFQTVAAVGLTRGDIRIIPNTRDRLARVITTAAMPSLYRPTTVGVYTGIARAPTAPSQ